MRQIHRGIGFVLLVVAGVIIGSVLTEDRYRREAEAVRVKQDTECGKKVIGAFVRGDLLEMTRVYRGEHKRLLMLFPQPKRQGYDNPRYEGFVVQSSPAAEADFWTFASVCTGFDTIKVIPTTSPEWNDAALSWTQGVRLDNVAETAEKR